MLAMACRKTTWVAACSRSPATRVSGSNEGRGRSNGRQTRKLAQHPTEAVCVQDMQRAHSPCLLPATLACTWCISSGRKESPSSGCSLTAADTAAAAARWTAGVPWPRRAAAHSRTAGSMTCGPGSANLTCRPETVFHAKAAVLRPHVISASSAGAAGGACQALLDLQVQQRSSRMPVLNTNTHQKG